MLDDLRHTLLLALLGAALMGCADILGERLDAADRRLIATATQEALDKNKTGEARNWVNPANGRRGTVVPTRTYGSSAAPCREFQQMATIEGRTIIAYDVACRDAGGRWRSETYTSLVGAIADAPPYYHDRYYEHHHHYPPGYEYDHDFRRYGRFGHYW